jgi:hypothetical protein
MMDMEDVQIRADCYTVSKPTLMYCKKSSKWRLPRGRFCYHD